MKSSNRFEEIFLIDSENGVPSKTPLKFRKPIILSQKFVANLLLIFYLV